MNIVLIGYRGTGKTTIGRAVAARLGREFVDTDALIVAGAGRTIKEIFESEGEAGFRLREVAAVREAAGRSGVVIATGGGVVLRPENVATLKAQGKVIWLRGDAETLHARITGDVMTAAHRPRLAEGVGGELDEVKSLLAKRTPLYESAADFVIDIGEGRSVEELVEIAVRWSRDL